MDVGSGMDISLRRRDGGGGVAVVRPIKAVVKQLDPAATCGRTRTLLVTQKVRNLMEIDGACHCGKIRYEAEINPDCVILCHCTDCQIMWGPLVAKTLPVRVEKLIIGGEPKRYIKTGSSGVSTTFCETCGSPILLWAGDEPRFVNLRLGSERQRS